MPGICRAVGGRLALWRCLRKRRCFLVDIGHVMPFTLYPHKICIDSIFHPHKICISCIFYEDVL